MPLRNLVVSGSLFSLIVLLALVPISCSAPDLSTPEKTIATYYRGYMTGEKNITEKTLMGLGRLGDTGFKPPIVASYRIIEKKEVKQRSTFAEVGDVEVVTEVKWKTGHPPQKFWYVLRKYDTEWKIVEYSALPSKDYPPQP